MDDKDRKRHTTNYEFSELRINTKIFQKYLFIIRFPYS